MLHFGQQVFKTVMQVIKSVHRAQGDPTFNLVEEHKMDLAQLQVLCEQHCDHPHEKTRQLARELLNEWQAI